jgi:hypothetical protein
MSRSDTFLGLCAEALEFLKENEIVKKCNECGSETRTTQIIGKCNGFDKYELRRHFLKDGRIADEFLQKTDWNSGPVLYLGLRVAETEIIWRDK